MYALSFFLKSKDTKNQKCKRGKHVREQVRVTNSQAVAHESWLVRCSPCALVFSSSALKYLQKQSTGSASQQEVLHEYFMSKIIQIDRETPAPMSYDKNWRLIQQPF